MEPWSPQIDFPSVVGRHRGAASSGLRAVGPPRQRGPATAPEGLAEQRRPPCLPDSPARLSSSRLDSPAARLARRRSAAPYATCASSAYAVAAPYAACASCAYAAAANFGCVREVHGGASSGCVREVHGGARSQRPAGGCAGKVSRRAGHERGGEL